MSYEEFKKHVILEDVNVPYMFSIDRNKNMLFFCINADEFSDQSFQSAILNLETGFATTVPNIRNGFASAVDNDTGIVYLGGSEGIFKYNYLLNDIEEPALLGHVDVFDMQFKNNLYFIDTSDLDLYIFKNGKKICVKTIDRYGIQHFTFAGDVLILSNSNGLYYLQEDSYNYEPVWFSNSVDNIRGLATDLNNVPHLVAQDGIYMINLQNMELVKLLSLEDGYALDFDKNNDMVYSDKRSVIKLIRS